MGQTHYLNNFIIYYISLHYDIKFQFTLGSTTNGTTTLQHTGHINSYYIIYHLFDLNFK
jgi:hypothetical protein